MNKKYLSALLFGALTLASTGTFTSCKDYDDDIKDLQGQLDAQKGVTSTLSEQVKALEGAANDAKNAAEAAKTAANSAVEEAKKAKAAGDDAVVKANTALAKAQSAEEAVQTVKQEAIEEAKQEVQALLDEVLKGYVTSEDLLDNLTALEGRLSSLVTEEVNKLTPVLNNLRKDVDKNKADILEQKGLLEELKGTVEDQIEAFDVYKETITERLKGIDSTIETEVARLDDAILGLQNQIVAINKALESHGNDIKLLQADVVKIQNAIKEINNKIADVFSVLTNQLKSITLAPDAMDEGVETIVFRTLIYDEMADETVSDEISEDYEYSTSELSKVSYHFNPKNFDLALADYDFAQRDVKDISPRSGEVEKWLQIEGQPVKEADGTVSFQVRRLNAVQHHSTESNLKMVALQATLKDEAVPTDAEDIVITSNYAKLYDDVFYADELFISEASQIAQGAKAHFSDTFEEATKSEPRFDLIYDKSLDLKALVGTCFSDPRGHKVFDTEAYNLDYRFYVASTPYMEESGSTETNQQTVVELSNNDSKAGVFVTTKLESGKFDKQTIGRTPILKVELVDKSGNIVRRGYVKVAVVAEKAPNLYQENNSYETLIYHSAATKAHYELNEEWMRANVYRTIESSRGCQSLSHEEFWNTYTISTAYATVNNKVASMTVPDVKDGIETEGTATKKITWDFNHGEIKGPIENGTRLEGVVVLKNKLASSEFPQEIKLVMVVNVELPTVSKNFVKNEEYWNKELSAFVVNVATPESTQSPVYKCVFKTPIAQAFSNKVVLGDAYNVASGASNELEVAISAVSPEEAAAGVYLEDGNICLNHNNAAVKKALNDGSLVAIVTYSTSFDSKDKVVLFDMPVNFVTPLTVTMPEGKYVVDAETGGSILDFDFNGMYRDWRGESVLAPTTVIRPGELKLPYWRKVCGEDHMVVIPGYQKVVTPEKLEVYTDVVTINGTVNLYGAKGSVIVNYKSQSNFLCTTKKYSVEVEAIYESPASAKTALTAKASKVANDAVETFKESFVTYYKQGHSLENVVETKTTKQGETKVTIVTGVDFTEATYEDVPAKIEKTACTEKPTFKGDYLGQKIGCWEWNQLVGDKYDEVPGQYWDFYGQPELTLDLSTVKTNIEYNNGVLPNDITLKPVGDYKLKYVNTGSPINETYTITLDAVVSYAWGEIRVPFTFTVYPVGQAPVAPEAE